MPVSPLGDFLVMFKAPYSGTWENLVTGLLEDEDELVIVNELREILKREGGFRQPVRVIDDEVGNGCHRVAASILEKVENIEWTDIWPADPPTAIEVEIVVSGASEALLDKMFGRLRSFSLDDELWVETDAMGGQVHKGETSVNGCWYCPTERQYELVEALVARVEALGMSLITVNSNVADLTDE